MLEVADRLAIRELIARYNHALDYTRDTDEWVGTFLPDGLFVLGRGERHDGEAELRSYFEAGTESRKTARGRILHWVENLLIHPKSSEHETRATSDLLLIAVVPEGTRVDRTGHYEDVLCKSEGRWRFRERRVFIDQYPPPPP